MVPSFVSFVDELDFVALVSDAHSFPAAGLVWWGIANAQWYRTLHLESGPIRACLVPKHGRVLAAW